MSNIFKKEYTTDKEKLEAIKRIVEECAWYDSSITINKIREVYKKQKSELLVKVKCLIAKPSNIEDVTDQEKEEENQNKSEWVKIRNILILEESEMISLVSDFLKDRNYLKGLEGMIMVTDGEIELVIDTQGYDYARYVGRIIEKTEL